MFKSGTVSWMIFFFVVALGGCDSIDFPTADGPKPEAGQPATDAAALGGPSMATVNGRPITQGLFEAYINQRAQRQPLDGSAEQLRTALDELIDMELVLQDAERKGLQQQTDIARQLELQRRSLLVRADLQDYVRSHPVTEEEEKAFYDEQIAALPNNEYKARHILTKTGEEARAIIAQLDKGADFVKLAQQHSTGPSAKQGGDLGWFPPNRMVAPFSEAIGTMEKGSYSKEPVKTQFGWHVILLEDTRPLTPPAFEQSRGQIQNTIRNRRLEQYIADLRTAAQIDIIAQPKDVSETAPAAETDAEPEADAGDEPAVDAGDEPAEEPGVEAQTETGAE